MPRPLFSILTLLLASNALAAQEKAPDPAARRAIEKWLAFQQSIRTIEADFVQSRELRTVRAPLRSEGKVWIDRAGDRFRWQAGDAASPKTIAVKTGDTLLLMQPPRKRAEKVSLDRATASAQGGGAEAAFDLASGGLPATYDSLTKRFTILGVSLDQSPWRIRLKPKDARLSEAVSEIVFLVDPAKYHLHGFDLTFRDGSKVGTLFPRQRFNVHLDATLFQPDLSGYDLR